MKRKKKKESSEDKFEISSTEDQVKEKKKRGKKNNDYEDLSGALKTNADTGEQQKKGTENRDKEKKKQQQNVVEGNPAGTLVLETNTSSVIERRKKRHSDQHFDKRAGDNDPESEPRMKKTKRTSERLGNQTLSEMPQPQKTKAQHDKCISGRPPKRPEKERTSDPNENEDMSQMDRISEADRNELKEFVPNLETVYAVTLQKMVLYDLPRYREFKRAGIRLRSGRFTVEENQRLIQNVDDFLALTGIDRGDKIFFPNRFKDEMENIKKLKRQHKFLLYIANGIPRTWSMVYIRGKKIYDVENYRGRFTTDEVKEMTKLHTMHGNNWAKIGELIGRSKYSVQKRFFQIAKNNGSWSQEEMNRLLIAVQDHLKRQTNSSSQEGTISRQKLYTKLPWYRIAQDVDTRSWSQCREKWMNYLQKKLSVNDGLTTRDDDKFLQGKIDLIKGLYSLEIEDAADIPWHEFVHLFGGTHPDYVQLRFHTLKTSHVPYWQTSSFKVIDFLYNNTLPKFEQEIKGILPDSEVEKLQVKTVYSLSEIFDTL
uniref:Transcription termination factor 1 n=1 Tax=Denticeps clupeoides TaxID=299321 RepID=A0AAY4ELN8_9TELE